MSNHHHNPLDPRDPLGAYVWFNVLTDDDHNRPSRRGRGPDGSPGFGCMLVILLVVAMAWVIIVGH